MSGNISPIFSRVGDIQGGVALVGYANDYIGTNANNQVVWQADPTNGGFLQRLRFKATGTNIATVARVFIAGTSGPGQSTQYNNYSTYLSAPGTPAGTPGTTGGSLATASYYGKVQAVDQYGAVTAFSAESSAVSVTGPTGNVAWGWTSSTGASSYRIVIGNGAGQEIAWFANSAANSFNQTVAYTNNQFATAAELAPQAMFYGEISLPATTGSSSSATPEIDYAMNVVLPPGFRIICGLGTTVANSWVVTGIGGKY